MIHIKEKKKAKWQVNTYCLHFPYIRTVFLWGKNDPFNLILEYEYPCLCISYFVLLKVVVGDSAGDLLAVIKTPGQKDDIIR